jgi:hypothetical protein
MTLAQFSRLDRRWVFLAMLLAVAVPMLARLRFPESPSSRIRDVFYAIEKLPAGSRVLIALDYDPASEGELGPMSAAFVRHCCEKQLKMYFLTLWDRGPPIIAKQIQLIRREYPQFQYGVDYVDFGFRAGERGVIKNVMSNLRADISGDYLGTSLEELPLTKTLKSFAEMDLLISVGSGSPGPQEWIQYAAAQYDLPMLCGSPGVQAPQLYPYLPKPLVGILAAIKGAAEYEQQLLLGYPQLREREDAQEGLRRMGPQLVAHVLVVLLIAGGNFAYWAERRQRPRAAGTALGTGAGAGPV